jgi:hypothetical protein
MQAKEKDSAVTVFDDPRYYVNRSVVLIHPNGLPGSILVCFDTAEQLTVQSSVFDSIEEAIPFMEAWGKAKDPFVGAAELEKLRTGSITPPKPMQCQQEPRPS